MGKSAPSPPPAPDPSTVANAQGAANVNTAVAQSALNNVNQVGPYGSVTYNQTGQTTTPDGTTVPQYTQTTTLTPEGQTTVNNQQKLAATLSGYGNQLATQLPQGPLDFSNAPALSGSIDTSKVTSLSSPTDFADQVKQAQDAAYHQAYDLVAPQQAYAKQQLDAQLANAGIPQGSAAYKQAQDMLANQQTAQNNNLALGAVGVGNAQQSALSGQALANNQASFNEASAQAQFGNQARSQATNEAQILHNQPFNELGALIQGSPALGQPNATAPAQTGIAPTDVTGAYGLNQAAQNTAYQGNLATQNSNMGAAAGLGSAALTAAGIFF